jgi:hypothetical protein
MNTVIILSGVLYNSMKQRPQHMAKFFAEKSYRVLYMGITEVNDINDNLYKFEEIKTIDRNFQTYFQKNDEGVYTLKKYITDNKALKFENLFVNLEKQFLPEHITYIVAYPEWIKYLGKISNKSNLIYDCLDDWESFVKDLNFGLKHELVYYERKIASTADLILVSARSLYIKMAYLNNNIYYLPNGVWNKDYSFKEDDNIPEDLSSINKPIVFFMGAIAEWVDIELIKYISEKCPSYSFVFVGPEVKQTLPKRKNIYYLGKKKYNDLPLYLNHSRVAIIPFKVTKLTAAVTPLKFYEYLSSSTPVVTTMMPDLIGLPGSRVAHNYEEFLNYIDAYIFMNKEEYDKERVDAVNTSKLFDWTNLLEPLCSFIDRNIFDVPSTSQFMNEMVIKYKNYSKNIIIKNELLALHNFRKEFKYSSELFDIENALKSDIHIDMDKLALAFLKEKKLTDAVYLIQSYFNTQKDLKLFTTYLDSILEEINKEILLEIFLLKLTGDIYEALRLADKHFLFEKTNPKFLGLLSGLYLDIGEDDISFEYALKALRQEDYLSIEKTLDIFSITFVIKYLIKLKEYGKAEEVALSIMKINKDWEAKATELLSSIYFTKYMN